MNIAPLRGKKIAEQLHSPSLKATVILKAEETCTQSNVLMCLSLKYTASPMGTNQPFRALWKGKHDQFLRNSSTPLPEILDDLDVSFQCFQ